MRAILTYHSLDTSGSVVSLDPSAFQAHMRWLASSPVRVVPLGRITLQPPGTDAVALTFDDGFRNFETEALPELLRWGLPATVFVVTDHVGGTNRWGGRRERGIPELPLMDWDGLARMAEAGVELGAHTVTHPRLPELHAGSVRDEMERAAKVLRERTGQSIRTFAYPYGAVSAEALEVARESFDQACTTELRPLGPDEDPHLLPRLDIHYLRSPAALSGWGTRSFRWRLGIRARARRIRSLILDRNGSQGRAEPAAALLQEAGRG